MLHARELETSSSPKSWAYMSWIKFNQEECKWTWQARSRPFFLSNRPADLTPLLIGKPHWVSASTMPSDSKL